MADVLLMDSWGNSDLKKYDEVTQDNAPENADLDWARKNGVIGPKPENADAVFTAVPSFDSDITPTALEILAAGGDVQKATEERAKKQREMIEEGRKTQADLLDKANANSGEAEKPAPTSTASVADNKGK